MANEIPKRVQMRREGGPTPVAKSGTSANGKNFASDASAEDTAQSHLVGLRRITQTQYRQIIADVFGKSIKLGGRFEPDQREAGLIAIGAGQVAVTASGFERYDDMARSVAAQGLADLTRILRRRRFGAPAHASSV